MAHRILLADDSLTIQKVVELSFSETDFELMAVGAGDKAVQALDEFRPQVVLADVVMPGLSGYEVCELVKARPDGAAIPVVLLTGTFEPFDRARAERAGCDSIVTKPFDSHALVSLVAELVRKGEQAREALAAAPPPPPAPEPGTEETVRLAFPFPEEEPVPAAAPDIGYQTVAMPIPTPDELAAMERAARAGETSFEPPAAPAAPPPVDFEASVAEPEPLLVEPLPPPVAEPEALLEAEAEGEAEVEAEPLLPPLGEPEPAAPQAEGIPFETEVELYEPPAEPAAPAAVAVEEAFALAEPEPAPFEAEPLLAEPEAAELLTEPIAPVSDDVARVEPAEPAQPMETTEPVEPVEPVQPFLAEPEPEPPVTPSAPPLPEEAFEPAAPEAAVVAPEEAPFAEAEAGETEVTAPISQGELPVVPQPPSFQATPEEEVVYGGDEPETRDIEKDMASFEKSGSWTSRPEVWEQAEAMGVRGAEELTAPIEEPPTGAGGEEAPFPEDLAPAPADVTAPLEVAAPPELEALAAEASLTDLSKLIPAAVVPAAVAVAPALAAVPAGPLSDDDVDRIARRVVELMGEQIVREIAWEVVPEMAERLVRERIRELEVG